MGFLQEARQKIFGHPHECPPGCQGCNDCIEQLMQTPKGIIALNARFGELTHDASSMGPIRTCVTDSRGMPIAICDAAIQDGRAEIGIIRDPDNAFIGAADQAFNLMTRKLQALGVNEVYGFVDEENTPSQNFLARNWFYPDIDDLDGRRNYATWRRKL